MQSRISGSAKHQWSVSVLRKAFPPGYRLRHGLAGIVVTLAQILLCHSVRSDKCARVELVASRKCLCDELVDAEGGHTEKRNGLRQHQPIGVPHRHSWECLSLGACLLKRETLAELGGEAGHRNVPSLSTSGDLRMCGLSVPTSAKTICPAVDFRRTRRL